MNENDILREIDEEARVRRERMRRELTVEAKEMARCAREAKIKAMIAFLFSIAALLLKILKN